jgi:hypothetical protein
VTRSCRCLCAIFRAPLHSKDNSFHDAGVNAKFSRTLMNRIMLRLKENQFELFIEFVVINFGNIIAKTLLHLNQHLLNPQHIYCNDFPEPDLPKTTKFFFFTEVTPFNFI